MGFPLEHQYVRSSHLPWRRWKVLKGSGMGLVHSGDLADIVLYNIMEWWALDKEWDERNTASTYIYNSATTSAYLLQSVSKRMNTYGKCDEERNILNWNAKVVLRFNAVFWSSALRKMDRSSASVPRPNPQPWGSRWVLLAAIQRMYIWRGPELISTHWEWKQVASN